MPPRRRGISVFSKVSGRDALASEGQELLLAFAAWRLPRLVLACVCRRLAPVRVLAPAVAPPRVLRAATLVLRLHAALAASVAWACCPWSAVSASEEVDAAAASLAELLAAAAREIVAGAGMSAVPAVPMGLVCAAVGLLVGLMVPCSAPLPPPGVMQKATSTARVVWWLRARRRHLWGAASVLVAAALLGGASLLMAALAPQPRATSALAAFGIAALTLLIGLPLFRGIAEAAVLWAAAHRGWSRCEALLAGAPGLMDFCSCQVPVCRWSDGDALLAHWERIARSAGRL